MSLMGNMPTIEKAAKTSDTLDHLTGTSLTTDSSGDLVAKTKYYPYGETRSSSGALGTDRMFTGQMLDGTGLYFYNARYYDPLLGRFISADTLVPESATPQSFNRYSYCLGNPLGCIDPSGRRSLGDLVNWAANQVLGVVDAVVETIATVAEVAETVVVEEYNGSWTAATIEPEVHVTAAYRQTPLMDEIGVCVAGAVDMHINNEVQGNTLSTGVVVDMYFGTNNFLSTGQVPFAMGGIVTGANGEAVAELEFDLVQEGPYEWAVPVSPGVTDILGEQSIEKGDDGQAFNPFAMSCCSPHYHPNPLTMQSQYHYYGHTNEPIVIPPDATTVAVYLEVGYRPNITDPGCITRHPDTYWIDLTTGRLSETDNLWPTIFNPE